MAELNAKKALAEQAVYFHMRIQQLAADAYESRIAAATSNAEIERLALETEHWKQTYNALLETLKSPENQEDIKEPEWLPSLKDREDRWDVKNLNP
jgi:hypothetical protein